jgi:hypothetical protein
MLEKFIYENHLGQRFIGLDQGVYLNYNDLRDYGWSYDSINGRISRFYRRTTDRKLPLVVHASSDAEGTRIKNRLLELAEADIEARIPGKLYIGEYYTIGYITASTKSDYLISKRYCTIDLVFTSDDPAWYREETHPFVPGADVDVGVGGGIDYPYDHPYDYALAMAGRSIMCDSNRPNAFRLLIYGEVSNPAITIGEHTYTVNGNIGKGETLLIDSMTKTITLTTASGTRSNWFDKRGREQYIFQPIPAGQNTVSWNESFGFDLTVIEERSEPRWT